MAWTQTDLDAIEAAIAKGEQFFRFADGREVQYRSVTELLDAREAIKQGLAPAGSTRCTLAQFRKD